MRRFRRTVVATAAFCTAVVVLSAGVQAEEPGRKGAWILDRNASPGVVIHTMEMTLHPRAEARPALKYRLIPDDFDLENGNAAIHYLKAVGFLEQGHVRQRLTEINLAAARAAEQEGKALQEVPPFVWQEMAPADLPLEEVREHLDLLAFQTRFVEKGARQRWFDMDRNLRQAEDPLGYLIPEVQAFRELARTQRVRARLAIAEGRVDDAIAILGQQYCMGRHLGQDGLLVSGLVGVAFAHLAWEDSLFLVQCENAPNLYWAFASVPRPAVDLSHSLGFERQLLLEQLKVLREVDDTPRPAGYWQDFVERLAAELGTEPELFGLSQLADNPKDVKAALVAFVAAAYPSAKRYLVEDCGLDRDRVEAYPTAQAVFLAVVRYYEEASDSCFKWNYLPYSQAASATAGKDFIDFLPVPFERAGLIAAPAALLLPAVGASRMAVARVDQQLALSQTVEAIRSFGATSGGKLPGSLDELPLPAPIDPVTGTPLVYERQGDHAVLEGHDLPGIRYRLVLRFAKTEK